MKAPATPYLQIDSKVLNQNLDRMAKHAKAKGINLRPHVKTHKSIFLGKRQLESGAIGITVATIGEAEVFAKKGFRDIFIAYPLYADENKLKRLKKLTRRISLTLAIDSIDGAKQLARELTGVKVLIEIDSGHNRSGLEPSAAGSLAIKAKELGLDPIGIFTFPGHSYAPKKLTSVLSQEAKALQVAVKSLESEGIAVHVVSTGSTPSATSSSSKLITELRPGVYIFNDAQQIELGTCSFRDVALTAIATVVSGSGQKRVVDSGSKVLGSDKAAWATGYGRLPKYPEARITALSEHHATIMFPKNTKPPAIGSKVSVVPNHVCIAVNLVAELYLKQPNGSLKKVSVSARGKNS